MALIKCSECGAEISDKATECPKCGCPVEVSAATETAENKKKGPVKLIIIIALALLLLAAVGFGVFKLTNKPDTSGLYNGFEWGMTYDEVLKRLPEDALTKDEKNLIAVNNIDYEGKEGIDVLVSYNFPDVTLSKITLYITNSDDSSYTDEALLEEYVQQMDSLYGDHDKDILSYKWNTQKSKIMLTYLSDKLFILSYEDITKADN